MLKYFVFFVFSIIFSKTQGTVVNSCYDSKGLFPNVTVALGYQDPQNECPTTPCAVIASCPVILNVDFIAPRYLESMKPQIIVDALGIKINYNLGQDDACKGITNTQCPVVEKERVSYSYALTLPGGLPEIGVKLQVSIIDLDINEDVVCFSMDAQVKNIECPKKN